MTNPWHIKRLVGLGTLTRIIFHIQMFFFLFEEPFIKSIHATFVSSITKSE